MRRVGLFGITVVALALIPAATSTASTRHAVFPVVHSLVAQPSRISAKGGQVHLVAHVAQSATCTFGGGAKTVTVKCNSGIGSAVIAVRPNPTVRSRIDRLWVLARGKGGTKRRSIAVLQVGKKSSSTTTTSTLPSKAQTVCNGPCSFALPQATTLGIVSLAMNSVSQGVSCPDSGLCDATSSQQVDDVNVTLCAGSSGDTDVASEIYDFSLALADSTQAGTDFVSFDGSVPTALGNYGAVAPNQCVTGDIFMDAPIGVSWTSLNYSYTSADFSTQTVYEWKS